MIAADDEAIARAARGFEGAICDLDNQARLLWEAIENALGTSGDVTVSAEHGNALLYGVSQISRMTKAFKARYYSEMFPGG